MSSGISWGKILQSNFFLLIVGLCVNYFGILEENFSGVLSKLNSMCPDEVIEEEKEKEGFLSFWQFDCKTFNFFHGKNSAVSSKLHSTRPVNLFGKLFHHSWLCRNKCAVCLNNYIDKFFSFITSDLDWKNVQWNPFLGKKSIFNVYNFSNFFGLGAKRFWILGGINLPGLSKLHFTCPVKNRRKNNFFEKKKLVFS